MHAFEYHRPASTQDALSLASKKSEGRYLAGGQSLVQAMKLRLSSPTDLIDLGTVKELTGIKARLSGLADDVLAGRTDKGVAAVASQVLNVYLRAVSVEMKVKEVTELEERISVLEASKAKKGEQRWGA